MRSDSHMASTSRCYLPTSMDVRPTSSFSSSSRGSLDGYRRLSKDARAYSQSSSSSDSDSDSDSGCNSLRMTRTSSSLCALGAYMMN